MRPFGEAVRPKGSEAVRPSPPPPRPPAAIGRPLCLAAVSTSLPRHFFGGGKQAEMKRGGGGGHQG